MEENGKRSGHKALIRRYGIQTSRFFQYVTSFFLVVVVVAAAAVVVAVVVVVVVEAETFQ